MFILTYKLMTAIVQNQVNYVSEVYLQGIDKYRAKNDSAVKKQINAMIDVAQEKVCYSLPTDFLLHTLTQKCVPL